ncbi:MAG: MauE/DoxX family redox-associated membrane protein [Acidimicrobiales bacterium]
MVLARVAAAVLAAVFVWAAVAKLRDREGTTVDFAAMGLPAPGLSAVVVPGAELAVAVALVVGAAIGGVPVGAYAAFVLLVGFTVHLASIVQSGRPVACRCFGGASTEPVSSRSLVRNAALLGLAAFVALVG